MLVQTYMILGLGRRQALRIAGITKHQLYYKTKGEKRGRRASTTTLWKDWKTQELLKRSNADLVLDIIDILSNTDLPNWYRMVTRTLQVRGWYVNHKKVYRIEKENGLLKKAKKRTGRTFVKFRRVNPESPLRVLEMDIKYCWIEGCKRYAYILTVIDTFSRFVLHWKAGYEMRQEQVKQVWEEIIIHYLQPADLLNRKIEIEVRNDNGKQFCAEKIQLFFKNNYLNQVFTHPYSPEENGHVESFHKTLGQSLEHNFFKDLQQLINRLNQFYPTYNNIRQHSSIAGLSPSMFWALWDEEKITMTTYSKKKATFKLNIPYQDVLSCKEIDRYHYRVLGT